MPFFEERHPHAHNVLQKEGQAFTEPVVFDAPARVQAFNRELSEDFYRPIDRYEGLHRYDPKFEWQTRDEKKLVRKIDYRICSWVCLMFFALQLDRANISHANSDNMLDDLGITTNDYNTGQTIFYICFLLAELPSQLISKKIGPDNWIPIQMVSWSLVACCQAFMTGRSSFWACRALLGLIEGGFIPDNILYLTYWYKGNELPVRLSLFWTSYQTTNIISAFLAFGLLRMRGINGMAGWQWLFALEGTLTGLIGIASWFYLPPSPTQTQSKVRGKNGWFSEHEEKIMVNRVLRDDPSKGTMHNRQALTLKMLWDCLKDYHMWPLLLIGLTWCIPTTPMQNYITLNLRAVGFGTFETNLLTIPAYFLFIVGLLAVTWISEHFDERFLLATVSQVYMLPVLIAMVVLPISRSAWVTWVLCVLLYAQPYVHAIFVGLTSRNAGSVRLRTVATALYNMSVQLSNIIGTNIYREDDKPLYYDGNKVLIGITCWSFCVILGTKFFYKHVNAKRDRQWNAMSRKEKEDYLTTTKDEGSKRLDFRFAH